MNNFSVFPMQYLEYASAKNLFIWNSSLTRSPLFYVVTLPLAAKELCFSPSDRKTKLE